MIDRKKVITGLRFCFAVTYCDGCPYEAESRKITRKTPEDHCPILDDALALLKEQEAKPMTEYDDGWDCPRCGLKLIGKTASGYPCNELDLPNDEIVKYCPVCGQAVTWHE